MTAVGHSRRFGRTQGKSASAPSAEMFTSTDTSHLCQEPTLVRGLVNHLIGAHEERR